MRRAARSAAARSTSETGASPRASSSRRDAATARDYARGPRSPYVHYFNSLFTKLVKNGRSNLFKEDPDMPDSALTLDHVLDRLVIHGTPAQVTDQLQAFREEVGPFGTLLYAGHDWVDPALARDSMRLMAEAVIPNLRD